MCVCVCVCLRSIHDQEELAAIELQIREFGQTPRRLFVLPHPCRLMGLSRQGSTVEVGEEEVRTVGATTEGLGRMDSWGQSPAVTPSQEDPEWVYVSLPGDKTWAQTSNHKEQGSLHSVPPNSCQHTLTLQRKHKVHRE